MTQIAASMRMHLDYFISRTVFLLKTLRNPTLVHVDLSGIYALGWWFRYYLLSYAVIEIELWNACN